MYSAENAGGSGGGFDYENFAIHFSLTGGLLTMKKSDIIKKLNVFFRDFIAEIQRYGINITREWIRDVIAPGNLGGQKKRR